MQKGLPREEECFARDTWGGSPSSSHGGVIGRQAAVFAGRPRAERAFWRRSAAARRCSTVHTRPCAGGRTRIAVRRTTQKAAVAFSSCAEVAFLLLNAFGCHVLQPVPA